MEASHQQREDCIRQYMQGWLTQNEELLLATLSQQIHIIESYGPEYIGLAEVQQWFRTWHTRGQVLRWDALGFLHQGDETVVKWHFVCRYEGNTSGFDGLSLVRFDASGRILAMEEYQSKTEHHRPYVQGAAQ
ncbi:MAG: nuclear transport factor 2 family protein [Clostridiales bacterium]|nr:nuclear transport factor 2 family protein [Clostridiales bacterium]